MIKINREAGENCTVAAKPTEITVDSGACDAVCPPNAFENTPLNKNNREYGKSYGACGGETVFNIGSKELTCLTESGISKYTFQVGDKLTKPLLAVSKICEAGKGVWFGPAPNYDSYIVNDAEAFVVSNGLKTNLNLINGTYSMKCHEVTGQVQNMPNIVQQTSSSLGSGTRGILKTDRRAPTPGIFPSRQAEKNKGSGWKKVRMNLGGADDDLIPEAAEVPSTSPSDAPPAERLAVEPRPPAGSDILEPSEDAPVNVKSNPLQPTRKQIQEHEARCHVPYRSWCPHCVRGSGREDPHRDHIRSDEPQVPSFTCDYGFLKSETNPMINFVFLC